MATLWRNQRGEIRHQHVKVHYAATFMFDLTSPTQTNDGTSHIDHDSRAYVPYWFGQCHGFVYVPFQMMCKDEGEQDQRLNFTPQ